MKKDIKINGMDCFSCKISIEAHFKKLGIESEIFVLEEYGSFEWDESKWEVEDILNNIYSLGYKPYITDKYVKTFRDYLENVELVISSIITALFFLMMMSHIGLNINLISFMNNGYIQLILSGFIQFYVGRRIYKGSWLGLKSKLLGMDFLIAFSTTLAYLYSVFLLITKGPFLPKGEVFFFETSAIVITFSLIGRIIEVRIKRKAKNQLKRIFSNNDKLVTLINGERKKLSELKKGEKILIKTGQKVPYDAKIIQGEGFFDSSHLTGESIPLSKKKGDNLDAGLINVGNAIGVSIVDTSQKSAFYMIVQSIRNLQFKKSNLTKKVDQISNYFTPAVIVITIINFFAWYFLTGSVANALYYSIAVAVVACPCALGLATPMSLVFGASKAIKEKILYNNGEVFEKITKINTLAFDKTGTLTKGEMFISKIVGDQKHIEHFVSLEIISMHPIAKAFMTYKAKRGDKFKGHNFKNYKELIGKGVIGKHHDDQFAIGSFDFITKENMMSQKLKDEYRKLEQEDFVLVLGAINKKVVTIFCLEDKLRDNAKAEIKLLKQKNIEPIMITGDNQKIAKKVAKQVGITKFYANVNPQEKVNIIKKIQEQNKRVGFIGDGVNDAKALLQSDLAIAMGSGSDIALSVADIVLLDSNIANIKKVLFISQKTLNNIKQNLFYAFLWNGTMIPIAAFGFLAPWVAAIAMSFESLVVVGNSSRLSLIKTPK